MLRIADTFIVENPETLDEAIQLLEHYGESAQLIAGGTDLLPNIKHGLHAPEVLINLKAVEGLREVVLGEEYIRLGALLPLHSLATNPDIQRQLPALSTAAAAVAGPQLRRMGTLGGNVCLDTRCVYINQTHFWRKALGYCIKKDGTACHVVSAGKRCVAAASNDTAPVLMVLGASLEARSPRGVRTLDLNTFYINDGVRNHSLAADEILTRITVPTPDAQRRTSFQKLRVRGAIDFPMLNLALSYTLDGESATKLDLVVSALAAKPRRIKHLPEGPLNSTLIDDVAERAYRQVRPLTNINGDVTWRREMVRVLVRRAFASLAPAE